MLDIGDVLLIELYVVCSDSIDCFRTVISTIMKRSFGNVARKCSTAYFGDSTDGPSPLEKTPAGRLIKCCDLFFIATAQSG